MTILLNNLSTSDNLQIPYWTYDEFQLDSLSDDECRREFRFARNDIYRLCDALGLPDEITFYNNIKGDFNETLYMLLKRFAYPFRYVDLVPRFARTVPQLFIIANHMTDCIFGEWG